MGGQSVRRMARGVWYTCKPAAKTFVTENQAVPLVSKSSSFAASATRPVSFKFTSLGQQSFENLQQQSVRFARLPAGLRTVSSMMPRHDATAAARLVSRLSRDLAPEVEGMLRRYVSPI